MGVTQWPQHAYFTDMLLDTVPVIRDWLSFAHSKVEDIRSANPIYNTHPQEGVLVKREGMFTNISITRNKGRFVSTSNEA